MEKIGVIITGGYSPEKVIIEKYVQKSDYIVAADSGYDIAADMNINVDYVIGDMDSIQNISSLRSLPEEKKEQLSPEKNQTDTELAINHIWKQGVRKIVLIGGGGGRLDHIIGILSIFQRRIHPSVWVTDNETVIFVDTHFSDTGPAGETVSIFPISRKVEGLYSEGLYWPLTGLEWRSGDIGISNKRISEKITISLTSGKLLVIMENRKERIYV